MSYHLAFHQADKTEEKGKQHCMRCHNSFDPERENSSTACVLLSPFPFLGPHTINAKEVDYGNFDICDPIKCGKVLYSFTFHLRLIQEEKKCRAIQQDMDRQDAKYRKSLEDQLEFLQKCKMRQAKMPKDRRNQLNSERVEAINQQYDKVVELMIQQEKEKLDLERWTRQVLNPSYRKKEQELFAKVPHAENKARQTWARIEQLARKGDDNPTLAAATRPTPSTTTASTTSENDKGMMIHKTSTTIQG